MAGPGTLLDREAALATCTAAVGRLVAGSGGVLVVSGPAGIGKSAVLAAMTEAAAREGVRCLTARASDVERDHAFGVVRQLTASLLRDREAHAVLVDVPPVALAAVGLPAASAVAPVPDVLPTVLHGLHWLLGNVAAAGPLLLAVDDAHWADEASLALAEYVGRRVREVPVLLVLAVRSPEPHSQQVVEVVARLAAAGDATEVRLEGLGAEAVGELARRALGVDPDGELAQACHGATGGNPFLVHALLDDLAAAGELPSPTAVAAPGAAAPEVVCRDLLLRLSRLPAECRAVADAVAVLGGDAVARDAAGVADLRVDEVERAADLLAEAGLLARARPLDFLHPLVRQAVLHALPPGHRDQLHRRAARQLTSNGPSASLAAAHLLAAGPAGEAWAVDVLRRAGAQAAEAGLVELAVRCLERALAEGAAGGSDEPSVEVLVELGLAQARAALPACRDTLAAALAAGVPSGQRAEIALELARARWSLAGDSDGALDALDEIAVGELDEDAGLRIAAQRVEWQVGWVDGLGGLGPGHAAAAALELERIRDLAYPPRPSSAVLLGTMARRALEHGEPVDSAVALADDAIAAGPESVLYSSGPDVLVWAEAYDKAQAVLDGLVAAAARSGSPYGFGVGSLWRGVLAHRVGDLPAAEADCRACVDVMTDLGVVGLSFPTAFLAEVVLERDVDEADALLAQLPPGVDGSYSEFYLHARGRVRLAQRRPHEAVVDLEAAERPYRSPAILPWRSSLALALAAVGDTAAARRWAVAEVELASAQGGARARCVALTALGRVLGPAKGLEHLEEAVRAASSSPAVLVRAEALAELGRFLRLRRRLADAREVLREALDAAHRCGAVRLETSVREELLAAGARPRRSSVTGRDALTASELRVAQLAADGATNRDIARALFVSPWTVASHLTRVYQKLGVVGREQLAPALGAR